MIIEGISNHINFINSTIKGVLFNKKEIRNNNEDNHRKQKEEGDNPKGGA
jgi:hypothetical protein